MSTDEPVGPDEPDLSALEQLLRSMLGPAGAEDALQALREQGIDPAQMASAAGLPSDPAFLQAIVSRAQAMMSSSPDEPVNWEVAHDLARQAAVQGGDPVLAEPTQRTAVGALDVADLWLTTETELPPAGGSHQAWSRSQWVERTLPTWRSLAEPIAVAVSAALADVLAGQLGSTPEALDALGPQGQDQPLGEAVMGPLLRQLGGTVFGMQVGHAAGVLSREVFGVTDIGLPLLPESTAVLVESNVEAFAEGLEIPLDEVRLYLALREVAHVRLFTHVSWLRGHLLASVDAYARGLSIDMEAIEAAVREIDPTDPASLQQALSGGVFELTPTEQQRAALDRLETSLALVEGWVDEVSYAAAAQRLPHAAALREMIRRRRAAGGPAEQTFATLVGLELRPRRSREAARLWSVILAGGDVAARDAVWDHPDLLPTAEDLDDPAGHATRRAGVAAGHAELDAVLSEILGGEDPDSPKE